MTYGLTFGDPVEFTKEEDGVVKRKIVTSFALIKALRKSGWTQVKKNSRKVIKKTKKTKEKT